MSKKILVKPKAVCHSCKHFFTDPSHFCVDCQACRKTCLCGHKAGIGPFKVPRAECAAIGNSSFFTYSRRAIGLEIELSDFGSWLVKEKQHGKIPNGPTYKVDHDGSVKPSQLEIVVDPLAGDQSVINGLNAIADMVWNNNCQVNETCGYHVHVDARDFSWADIQKLMFLWFKLETSDNIWKLAGRRPNDFCRSWQDWWSKYNKGHASIDLKEFKVQIIKALYGVDTTTYKDSITTVRSSREYLRECERRKQRTKEYGEKYTPPSLMEWCENLGQHTKLKANRGWNRAVKSRYLDLNIHSWLYRGTVEYRLGNGTVDVDDIRMWPLWCLWLTEIINRTNFRIIQEYCKSKTDPIDQIIKDKGFKVPSFMGETIYPIAPYLLNWLEKKVNT